MASKPGMVGVSEEPALSTALQRFRNSSHRLNANAASALQFERIGCERVALTAERSRWPSTWAPTRSQRASRVIAALPVIATAFVMHSMVGCHSTQLKMPRAATYADVVRQKVALRAALGVSPRYFKACSALFASLR